MSKPVQGICPSCNVAYVDHLGLIPLREVRQVLTKENNELRAEIANLREANVELVGELELALQLPELEVQDGE